MTPQHIKSTVKLFFLAITFVAVAGVSASAQGGGRLSAGAEIAVPLGGYLGNVGSIGIGGFAKWEQPIPSVPMLNWTAQTGFVYFPGSNYAGYKTNTTAVPFLGGVRYYFMDRFNGWYVSGDAGFTFFTSSYSRYDNSVDYYGYGSVTRFTFAPGGGYHIANWDFSGRFVLQSDFSYLSLRAAYVWNKFGR